MTAQRPVLQTDEDAESQTVWPSIDLTIEELDEPVFQPQQIVPNTPDLNELTQP